MSDSTNLGLQYIAPGQAQKHVTVNESLRRLDAIIQLSAMSASLTAQPSSPADGGVWIIPPGKSGAQWSAYGEGSLAYYRDGAWVEIAPREGWLAYVRDTGELRAWSGAEWARLAATDARQQCASLGTWHVLAASAVAHAHTGSTAETTLVTVSVPAGAMGPNGALRIYAHWSHTNSANIKTPRIRLGGTLFASASQTAAANFSSLTVIQNRNTEAVQVAMPSGTSVSIGSTANALASGAVDTSAAQDITFSAQLANGAETLTLERYIVEVLYGA